MKNSDKEPVAWSFELATCRDRVTGAYLFWNPPQLSFVKPCVPEGSIRNLTPLGPLTPKEAPAALCEHGHTDPMALCSDCEAASVEAPAATEAGDDDLAARLRRAETWDLDADQEARDRCGVLMLEAAERLDALRAQPQARSTVSVLAEALHDRMFGVSSLKDPALALAEISDGGGLHEAAHELLRALPARAKTLAALPTDTAPDAPSVPTGWPEAPWPPSARANGMREGWKAFYEGRSREACPFPPSRHDLTRQYQAGWDFASKRNDEESDKGAVRNGNQ